MKQQFFAAAWGILDSAGGAYPLSKLPEIVRKLKSLGYVGIEIPIAFVDHFRQPHRPRAQPDPNPKPTATA